VLASSSRMPHRHRRWWPFTIVLFLTAIASASFLLVSCSTATPAPTTVPATSPQPVTVSEENELPPFVLDPNLPADIVLNAEQGLGQCHWLDPDIVANPLVSWAYDSSEASTGWNSIEPEPGVFYWDALDAEIEKAAILGKRIWIELHTTEGRTPQWALDQGVELVGSRGGTPLPWNETYQRLLRRAIHAMAARYDGHPAVDAVNVMAGGCYGEMEICAKQFDLEDWEQAGYTDERFIQAVNQIVDIYLEEEYTWEDGTKTHGFQKTPVVLQLGSGLYERTRVVIQPVVEHCVGTYGERVWLKFNGWGTEWEMRWIYQDYDTVTRVGYEPAGNSTDFLDNPQYYVRQALDHHSSYVCLQSPYFDADDPKWQEAREMAARYLGAQIVHEGTEAPSTVLRGQAYDFVSNWVNRGTVPPMRFVRQGIKSVPVSYDILIALVDPVSGSTVFEHTFTPAVPTTKWYSAQPVTIQETLSIPSSVPLGTYDLRTALVNPGYSEGDQRHFLRLVNVDQHDGSGRYTVGQINVGDGGITPTATPAATETPSAAELPPVIFVMLDWFNGDWGNPDYRYSYVDEYGYRQEYRGHPEYGALGGWSAFAWNDLNPEKGFYNWSKTDKYVKEAQAMQVTLPDGSVIAKPVGIAVQTWAMEETDTQIGVNYTPYWVGAEAGEAMSVCYDPDDSGPCKPFCTPRFRSTVWQYWFDQFVLAMGQHYDNNPEFYNLSLVLIATGVDDETSERKSLGDCAYDTGGNTKAFDDWVLHVMETYNLAFPSTPHFIQSTLHGIHYHAELAASFPSKMTGVKVNGLEVDVPSAEVRFDGELVGGVTGFSEVWHEVIPTGFEPKHGNGIEGSYWFYMQGLSVYPDMFDIQLPNIADAYQAEQQINFPIQDFVRTHLGKTAQNAPDVWIVLRDTYFTDTTWTGSDGIVRTYGPHHGDLAYYLYRRDTAPGSQSVAVMAEMLDRELPSLARSHIYGWHSSRRTDQASGNPYMSFDVDDRYPYAGQVPKAAGGEVSWQVNVTLVNKGLDTFSLEYLDYYGNLVEHRVTKGPALGTEGQWVDYTWTVHDAYFANGLPGGNDFRIDSNNDGDEIVHRLIVSGEGPTPPTPTPTRTRPPTSTPTRTTTPPTPTPVPTSTTTRTPAATPTDTITPTPAPTLFPPGRNTVTLQDGYEGYLGTKDTYMYQWEPQLNTGHQANIRVKNDSVFSTLLRFDLSSVPPGSTINQATLALYAYLRDNELPIDIGIYRVLRPWDELEAHWERASIGRPWGAPGCNDTATDREPDPAAVQTVSVLNTWYEVDVTQLVRDWTENPAANYGMILRGQSDRSVHYDFASSDHVTQALRPMLVIDYTAPEAPATATPTAVPTPSGTPTIEETPTPSGTPTASVTPTASISPTSTGTPKPSPTATSSPTAFPGGRHTVTLQQGVTGYQGTGDTYISAWSPSGNFVHQANLMVKNDSVYSGLLRFDLSSMPREVTVNRATLRLNAYNRDTDSTLDLEIYRVRRPWVDTQANWNQASTSNPWGVPGVNDTSTDRDPDPVAVQTVSSVKVWYEMDVTELVQDWATNPQVNYGVVLRGSGTLSVVYHFASSNHPTISLHPQLVIDYTAPEVPITLTPEPSTPTATPTMTLSATPSLSPTATGTEWVTPTGSPSPVPTTSPTTTPSPSPGPELEEQIAEMERRAGILEQLIWTIIDILRRASRVRF
jgi:hypothetical protein